MFNYKIRYQSLPRCCGILLVAISTTTAVADTVDDFQPLDTASPAVVSMSAQEISQSLAPTGTLPEPGEVAAVHIAGFGTAVDAMALDDQRGGSDLGTPLPLSGILTTGVVGDNRAVDVVTGSNAIRDGAFTNASGIPVVIQNTGANVLIQNSTIVNVQLH